MDGQTTYTSRKPNDFVRKAAQTYNHKHGLGKIVNGLYVVVDEGRARNIAEAYEALPVDGTDNPLVRDAFQHLAQEVELQWSYAIQSMGMAFEPWPYERQPYGTNSAKMCGDIRNHRHLYYYRGGDPHPLLGKLHPATGLSLNDKFRAIHDLFGHAAEGYGFGPRGEENAWIKHSQMFSAEAQKALTTETRGQNSWVNFGTHNYDSGGIHRNRPLSERPYATQKVALLPVEFMDFKAVIEANGNCR